MNTDLTGYGPTSSGSAPSPWEMQRNAQALAMANKMSTAMQYHDPSVVDMAMAAMRLKTGEVDPAKLREQLYNTKTGQGALDFAMTTRHAELWGKGSPVNASTQIANGVMASGFSMNVRDDQGRMIGAGQRVTGSGMLSERVGLAFQEQIMGQLSSSTNGLSREQMADMFRYTAANSGIGNVATIQHEASLDKRFAASRDSAMPDIRDKMMEFGNDRSRMGDYRSATEAFEKSGRKDSTQLNKFLDTIADPKLRQELSSTARSTDAIEMDQSKIKSAIESLKAASAGVAAVSEIWPHLKTMQEKMQHMQAITGVNPTLNPETGKKATQIMNRVINETPAGITTGAFAETIMNRSATMRDQFMQVTGLDERSNSAVTAAAAAVGLRASLRAAHSAQYQKSIQAGAEPGVHIVARTENELAADEMQGNLVHAQKRIGIVALTGAMEKGLIDPKRAKQAAELRAQYEAASTPREMALIDMKARNLLGGKQGFVAWSKGGIGAEATTAGLESDTTAKDTARERRVTLGIDDGFADIAGGNDAARSVLRTIGAGGLREIRQIAKEPGVDTKASIREILKSNKMTDAEADSFLNKHIAADGSITDTANFDQLTSLTSATDRNNASVHGGKSYALTQLSKLGQGDRRKVVEAGGGGIRGLMKTLTDKLSGANVDDGEMSALGIEALQQEGIKFKGGYASDIDLSKGVTADSLAKIASASGTSALELAKKSGYSSVAELEAATKDPEKRLAFIRATELATGMTTTGTESSRNFISKEAMDEYASHKGKLKELAAAEALNPLLGADEQDAMKKSILNGEGFKLGSNLQASGFDDGGYMGSTKPMANLHNMNQLAKTINEGSDTTLGGIKTLDKDGAILHNLESQRDSIKQAMDAGRTSVKTYDNGKETSFDVNETVINAFNAAIEKLKGAQGETNAMNVTNLTVTGKVEYKQNEEPS